MYSVIDNKILREYNTTCKQFEDRIEFKDKNGITVTMRPDGSGNINLGEYTYKRIETDEPGIEKRIMMLLQFSEPKKANINNQEDNLVSTIKTYTDKDINYNYVEKVGYNISNSPAKQRGRI